MNNEDAIVTALKDLQASLAESDGEFAARLGVNRTTWVLVRTRGRRPGRRLLGGAATAFPGLRKPILDFLMDENVAKTTGRG